MQPLLLQVMSKTQIKHLANLHPSSLLCSGFFALFVIGSLHEVTCLHVLILMQHLTAHETVTLDVLEMQKNRKTVAMRT